MGYDLHITRATNGWSDHKGCEISAEEWLTVVNADPDLKLAGYNGKYFTLWAGNSRYPEPWFNWSRGNVMTKNPDPPLIAKAIALAARLNAHVEGDDGDGTTSRSCARMDGSPILDSPGSLSG